MFFYRLMIVILLSVIFLSPVSAQNLSHPQYPSVPSPRNDFEPRTYVCFKTDGYMRIDGKIDEEFWKKAAWSDDYRDIVERGKKPRNRVRSKMLWDDTFFYVATEIKTQDIWAKSVMRDAVLYLENAWEIFIDPDGSSHHYMELQLNAFGTEWDLLLDRPYRDGGHGETNWNIEGLQSLAQVYGSLNRPGSDDDKWTVEVAIPWCSMPDSGRVSLPPQDKDQWRVNMARVEWPLKVENNRYVKQENDDNGAPVRPQIAAWSSPGVFNLHYPEQWGIVQFSDSLAGKIHLRTEKRAAEQIKWALRQVYYAQRQKFAVEGRFASVISELNLKKPKGKFQWPPQIKATDLSFTASLAGKEDSESWQIDHLGEIILLSKQTLR